MTVKKKPKPRKPRKSTKKKKKGILSTIFTVVFFCLLIYLAYYFVSAINKQTPAETALVAIESVGDSSDIPPHSRDTSHLPPHSWGGQGGGNIEDEFIPPPAAPASDRPISEPPLVGDISDVPPSTPPAPILPPTLTGGEGEGSLEETSSQPSTTTASPPPTETPITRDRGRAYVINPLLPKICIIIDDFGAISSNLFDRFNSLDKEIAFAILPGYRYSQEHMNKAVDAGREVMIHIPMEPESTNERLEPITIKTSMNDFEIKAQVESWMYEFPEAIGVNNHMGSKATQDERVLYATMISLIQNDLFFIDSVTTGNSKIRQVAEQIGLRTTTRDIFLDVPDTSLRAARQKINQIKAMNQNDVIVVITHCHNDAKYRQLTYFIDRLKDEGYQLIPPSMAVR